jgi:hypothetical protein
MPGRLLFYLNCVCDEVVIIELVSAAVPNINTIFIVLYGVAFDERIKSVRKTECIFRI